MIDTLKSYPATVGLGSLGAGSAIQLITWLSPYLQFIVLCISIVIGVITARLKWKEWKERNG